MNLPNLITLGRLGTSIALFSNLIALRQDVLASRQSLSWVALGIFVLTATTDWLDGHLARRRGEVTVLGRMMDPFVDKVLICGTLVFLVALTPQVWPPWMVVVIVVREFLVSGIRGYMESRGINFAAKMVGKVKMVLQCVAVSATLLLLAVGDPDRGQPPWLATTCLLAAWAALLSTVYSGWIYTRVFYRTLRADET